MMKHYIFSIAAVSFFTILLSPSFSKAQETIVEYTFLEHLEPTTLHPNVDAGSLTPGPNTGFTSPSSDGAFANGWPLTSVLNQDYYFQITISPNEGYSMNIEAVNFNYRRSSSGPLFYEVYWSTDGLFTNSTRIDSVAMPNDAFDHDGSLSGLNIDIEDGETIYMRWYAYGASHPSGSFRIGSNNVFLEVEGTVNFELNNTFVYFTEEFETANESDGTYDIDVSILNPDNTATSVDVVLISGDNSLINGYTTQTVTFPANSSANETVTLTITDDALCGTNGDLVFELQNVTGGDSAEIFNPTQFTLSIGDNDQVFESAYNTDFEDNNLSEWTSSQSSDWTTTSTGAINGTFSMKHNLSGVAGSSAAATSLSEMNLNLPTTWEFQIKNGNWTASSDNKFWVYIASSNDELLPTSSTTGYAVGVNMDNNNKLLTLFRVDNGGTVTPVIESVFEWNSGNTIGISVTRNASGQWELLYDADGGFDNLVSAGVASDDTYSTANYFGPVFEFTSSRAGEFWLDDISIEQGLCATTYYSQSSGNMTDAIWDVVPSGVAGSAEINRYNDFVIQAGHEVTLNNDAEIGNLEIESGAELDLNTEQYSLKLGGNWTNNGTFTAGDGAVHFIGANAPRSITGNNAFFDLRIDLSGSSISLNDDSDIWGTLWLDNGVLDVNGNVLTLKSDANNTAAVGPVENGSVSGEVTVERYIQNGINSWRNLGASVSGATLQDWNDHFTTTGFPGADFPHWPSPENRFPNIKSYDETDLGDREIGWRPATNITSTIGDGQGFWMYIGGSELPNTVDVTGTLITGEHTLNLDYTPNLGAYHDGWNLVSNMYAATIDWDSPEFDRTGLEDGVWIWNQDVQQYGSYIGGVGTHAVNNEIAHSQSFWVHANAASPTLTFRESIKSNNNNADWIKSEGENPAFVRLNLSGNGYYDETVVVFNDHATVGYEGTHDAMKFFSVNEDVPSLATVANYNEEQFDLAINTIPLTEDAAISIPLKALAGANGTYTLSVSEIENLPISYCVYVEDLETGEVMVMAEDAEMSFSLDTAYTAARFVIHITGSVTTTKTDNLCYGDNSGWLTAQGSGEGPWTYTWKNEMDEVIQLSENIFSADTLSGLSAGAYHVEVSGNNDVCGPRGEYLVITEPAAGAAEFSVTPPTCNEGSEGSITVDLANGSGEWNLSLLYGEEIIEVISTTENVAQFNNLSTGSYTVITADNCGQEETTIELFDENVTIADFDLPQSEISLQEGGTIFLSNLSENALLYYWEMGDGTGYFTSNVTHTYTEPGQYNITLYSTGDFCDDHISKVLTVTDNSVSVDEIPEEDIRVWFNGQEVVIEHNHNGQEVEISVMNLLGKTMMTTQSFEKRIYVPMAGRGYASGVYFVRISVNDSVITEKVVIDK